MCVGNLQSTKFADVKRLMPMIAFIQELNVTFVMYCMEIEQPVKTSCSLEKYIATRMKVTIITSAMLFFKREFPVIFNASYVFESFATVTCYLC